MNDRFIESRKAIAKAREALKAGNMTEARQQAERAAELAPQSEDPWLILAAVVSPRESVEYIRKALDANPNSPRAKKGMEWAMRRLGEKPEAESNPEVMVTQQVRVAPKRQMGNAERKHPQKRSRLLPILLIVMGCAVFSFAAWSAVTSPVLASIINFSVTPQVETKPFAQVNIPKPDAQPQVEVATPTTTPAAPIVETESTPAVEPTSEVAAIPPTAEPTLEVSIPPTDVPLQPTSQPGAVSAEIIADTPTPEYTEPTVAPYTPPEMAGGVRWIDVDLSQQRLYAYEGDVLMNSFIVSTGTWQTPTVTGEFKIWIKVRSQAMTGPGYYLPDVPYVMYFYGDYGIHGTYWHNNFGTPMSHGCVNLTIPDAEWLYGFASVGTVVNVHD